MRPVPKPRYTPPPPPPPRCPVQVCPPSFPGRNESKVSHHNRMLNANRQMPPPPPPPPQHNVASLLHITNATVPHVAFRLTPRRSLM